MEHDKLLAHDASFLETEAGGKLDIAIVLGTGLSAALTDRFEFDRIPYDQLLGVPVAPLIGHAGEALIGSWHGKRVVAFAGRVHLYQGFSAQHVASNVRLAHAAGVKTIVLTNAAGALNEAYAPGDLMLISDQINLTGRNPLAGVPSDNPFVDMMDAYSSRLREIFKEGATPDDRLREGVYAGLLGPNYESPAEARYLRTIGADAVGMSTVLETIAARALEMNVLGVSMITNIVGAPETLHTDVSSIAMASAPRLAALLDKFISRL